MFTKHWPKELDGLKPEGMTVIYNTTQTTESQIPDKRQSPPFPLITAKWYILQNWGPALGRLLKHMPSEPYYESTSNTSPSSDNQC